MSKNTWTTGQKFDQGKPALSLIDRGAMEELAAVLTFGAKKYTAHNWRKGIEYSRLSDAALRHIFAFIDGEDLDVESGLPHLGHAMCCLMFLTWMSKNRIDLDDRHGTQAALSSIEAAIKTEAARITMPRTGETADMTKNIKEKTDAA